MCVHILVYSRILFSKTSMAARSRIDPKQTHICTHRWMFLFNFRLTGSAMVLMLGRWIEMEHTKYLFIESFRIIIADARLATTESIATVVLSTDNKFIVEHIIHHSTFLISDTLFVYFICFNIRWVYICACVRSVFSCQCFGAYS